jgi:MoxR-like ATPase
MSVDFNTFLTVAPHVLDAKLPVLLRGRHGVGKSQVVYQIANERTLPVVERRASQMTEGDPIGS